MKTIPMCLLLKLEKRKNKKTRKPISSIPIAKAIAS
jgi:hypothetical protein